jgi:hypothetical protein
VSDDNVTFLPGAELPSQIARVPRSEQSPKMKRKANIVERAKARHRILQLVAAGLNYDEIAEQMIKADSDIGRTPHGVKSIINNALRKWAEENSDNLAEYREKKLYELETLKRALWTQALQGDVEAVKEARQIIKTQADMSGATAPQKHEHRHSLGVDESEIRAMEQAWVNAAPIGELPPGEEIVDGDVVP